MKKRENNCAFIDSQNLRLGKNKLGNFWVVLILGMILLPPLIFAQTGNHFGEQKFLTYRIEYLEPLGVTIVDKTGVTYKPFYNNWQIYQDKILPDRYFGEYSLYFTGGTVRFEVTVKNEGPRLYRNLLIESFQEFLNIDGGPGEVMGDNNKNIWFVEKLGPQKEIVLEGEFGIPTLGESGIDQTHLRISHWTPKQFTKGQIILEDFQAGLWCPMGIF